MRKFLFFLLIAKLVGLELIGAQTFAPVGAEWHYGTLTGVSGGFGYEHFIVQKDTTYLGKECRKIKVGEYAMTGEIIKSYAFYLYEVGDSVMYSYNGSFHLLYNFGLKVGDTLRVTIPYQYIHGITYDSLSINIVDSISFITESGKSLKKIYFRTASPTNHKFFGITDCLGGFKYFFPYDWGLSYDLWSPYFRCYSDQQIVIEKSTCDEYHLPNSASTISEPIIEIRRIGNHHFYLDLSENVMGSLDVKVFNNLGQGVYSQKFFGSYVDLILPESISSGLYIFSIRVDNNYFLTTKYFIQ